MTKVSASYHLVASPGQEGYVDLYEVPRARILHNVAFTVHFPIGALGDLEVALFHGIMQVLPDSGKYTGDGSTFQDRTDGRWWSNEKVKLYFKNTNTTENRECYVLFEGELE